MGPEAPAVGDEVRPPRRRRWWRPLFAPFEPVRVRITLAATIAFGLAFAGASVALVHTVRNSLESRQHAEVNRALRKVASQLEAGVDPDRLKMSGADPAYAYYQIYTSDGRVIAGSTDPSLPTLHLSAKHVARVEAPDGSAYDVVWRDVEVSSGTSLTVAVGAPLVDVRRSVDTLATSLWIGTPGLIVLVGMVAWVLVGRALRPVEALRAQVDEITATTMYQRLPVPRTKDEVARLARTMNGMLERLEQAAARQRAFVSDASHELRSPVSTIRTELEVASADADADWPDVAARTLGETERLSRLVDDLLALARLDESPGVARRGPVDLDDLALEEGTRTHRIPVATVGVSAGRVNGDERQLAQVVRNLVDNAQRHARSQVAISLQHEDDDLVLVVDDDGPGVPEADRERIFDRFTRLDEARGRADGGAGLGLAVVRRVVEHHGGSVSVVPSDPAAGGLGGARFVVRLPAARPPIDPPEA